MEFSNVANLVACSVLSLALAIVNMVSVERAALNALALTGAVLAETGFLRGTVRAKAKITTVKSKADMIVIHCGFFTLIQVWTAKLPLCVPIS